MSPKKTILITGGNGNLATAIKKYNDIRDDFNIFSPPKHELDITCIDALEDFLNKQNYDYIIHAAAYTKPMYKHAENPDISIKTNIIGTSNVVIACLRYKCKLVYISTDYVYPGMTGNYSENDAISPYLGANDGITKYGWSKLGGECSVRLLDNSLILRACLCDFPFPHTSALVDVKKSLMYHHEAAPIILGLLEQTGTINLGGKSQSVYDFAKNSDSTIKQIHRKDIIDVRIAPDTSMNTQKLKDILNEN